MERPEAISNSLHPPLESHFRSLTESYSLNSLKSRPSANSFEAHGLGAKGSTVPLRPGPLEESNDANGPQELQISQLRLVLLMFGLCLVTFVVALDNTIIATAIPRITSDFQSLGDVGWYGSAYLLTTTALQPTFGKVYTFFNVKWIYVFAILVFELGSILCAAARNSVMLIIGRAVAGIGGAALFSGGLTILALLIPIKTRALYSGILTSMFGISAVVGPLLGGVFTDRLSWRWCFWINLPFGGVALIAVLLFFRMPERPASNLTFMGKMKELDLPGASLLIPGMICLLLALQWGGTEHPWSDSRVWGCLLGFGLLIACFAGVQKWRQDKATIPPRVIKQRTVFFSCLFMLFLTMGIYTHFYYLPFYFQAVRGSSAEDSGIRTIPYIVSLTLFSIAAGASISIIGWFNPFLIIGSSLFVVGSGLVYTFQVDTGTGRWIGYQILAGSGAGLALQVPFIAVQVVLDQHDMPTGNALTGFFNSCGAAVSISVAQNIFSNILRQQLQNIPEIDSALVIGAGATEVERVTPPEFLPQVLEAYNTALTSTFAYPIAAGGLAVLFGFGVEWKRVKNMKIEGGVA